jgi:hypothetical protein
MPKELSIEEMSEVMILFEQAEALIEPKDREALQKAEEVFNVACKMRAKVSGGLIDPNEVPNIWEKTLEVVPGAKDALHKKFNKARELLSLSQLKNPTTH